MNSNQTNTNHDWMKVPQTVGWFAMVLDDKPQTKENLYRTRPESSGADIKTLANYYSTTTAIQRKANAEREPGWEGLRATLRYGSPS